MGTAVCIRCGSFKRAPFARCRTCGYAPGNDRAARARSLVLSTAYYDAERDCRPTRAELEQAASVIRDGGQVEIAPARVAALVDEQRMLDESRLSWLHVICLLCVLIALPVGLFVLGWLLDGWT